MAAADVDDPAAVGVEPRLAASPAEGRQPPLSASGGAHHVDLVADAPVGGEDDERAVRAPAGVAHDRAVAVPGQDALGACGEVHHEQVLRTFLVREESDLAPVRGGVDLPLRERVRPHPRGRPALGPHPVDLRVARAVGGEVDGPAVAAPARQGVGGGVVGEPPLHAPAGRDHVEVLVAGHRALEDQVAGGCARPLGRPPGRGRAAAAAGDDPSPEQRRDDGRPGRDPEGASLHRRRPGRASPWRGPPARP